MNLRPVIWLVFAQQLSALDRTNNTNDNSEPRIDYDQWKPLGRGDPLKQDPTYDYVPPVLDRVHYWIDPVTNRSDNANKKNEVLLLGVIAKKTTTTTTETPIDNTQLAESRQDSSNYLKYLANFHVPLFGKSQHNEQRVPYTVLMPPPVITTVPPTKSPTEFTIEPSRLIYQSSSGGLKGLTTQTHKYNEKIALHNNLQLPENYIKLQFNHDNSNRLLLEANSDHNVNYVTPPTLQKPEIMHKGHVSDENLEDYVKIGRIEAQMQHDNTTTNQILLPTQPVTLQTIKMKNFENPLVKVLNRESTEPPIITTTITESLLTTDPLFKHYKQPSEPVKGPLYLIIQGHSKVKTYGPSKHFYGIKIEDDVGKFDDRNNRIDYRKARSNDLQTLKHVIQTKLGAIDVDQLQSNEYRETELHYGYSIDDKDVSSEKYYKGYVADGRMIRNSS